MEFSSFSVIQNKASTTNQTTQQQGVGLSADFVNTLNNVVSRNMVVSVQPNEHMENMAFNKKKEIIEDGTNMVPEDEENEPIHKTVHEVEKRLVALARLERRCLAGF